MAVSAWPTGPQVRTLLSLRSYATSLLSDTGCRKRTDLVVTAGWLSALLAMSATDTGDHPTALVWCSDTERCGRDTGHPELAGWAVLNRALIAYYQGQADRSASLAGHGQNVTRPGTVIYAKLVAQEMRSRAMLGDVGGMVEAKRRAAAAIEGLTSDSAVSGVFSIPLDEDPPYTATSLLLVRRCRDAAEATRRILGAVYGGVAGDQPAKYARTLLILGLAQVGLGLADDAAASGTSALDCAPPTWQTFVLAERLDRLLAGGFPRSSSAAGYHARYIDAAGRLPHQAPRGGVTHGRPYE